MEQLPPEMIAEEYRARLRWRDNPNEGSYSLRFPKQIDRLASLLAEIKAEADADTWNGGNLSGKSLDQDLGGEKEDFSTVPIPQKIGKYHVVALLDEGGQAKSTALSIPNSARR